MYKYNTPGLGFGLRETYDQIYVHLFKEKDIFRMFVLNTGPNYFREEM